MATLSNSANEKVYSIKQFLGLNEQLNGDVKLKLGEASVMRNWKVTRDGCLQRRPGLELLSNLGKTAIQCLWSGWVAGAEYLLAVCGGHVYIVDAISGGDPVDIGSVHNEGAVHIFGFASKAYFLDGHSFKEWDGTGELKDVEGYVPLVAHAIGPDDTEIAAGELLEQVNKLTPVRRVWITGDGEGKTFTMPEKGFSNVTVTRTDTTAAVTGFTVDSVNGKITFETAPERADNVYEIQYTMPRDQREEVHAMRFTEIFAGAQDNRVVFYGDGTNEMFYSELDYWGQPRADYIPDMNEIAIGEANTPITGVIRHYGRLVVYKNNSTWSVSYSTITLSDGDMESAFYVNPVNRNIGNDAPGQVCLVLNSPRTFFRRELYEWKSNTSFSGNLTADERQAIRISDRINQTIGSFTGSSCVCYDDNSNQEYYISCNGVTLVHNYATNAWYTYRGFTVRCMVSHRNILYIGTPTGDVLYFSPARLSDYSHTGPMLIENPEKPGEMIEVIGKIYKPIDAYWESGAVDFGADYMRKYSNVMWATVKPEQKSYVLVSAMTDRKDDFDGKEIRKGYLGGFANWSFTALSFEDNTMPFVVKIKLKAKKFLYYKIILENNEADTTATMLCIDIRCRATGYAK